MRSRSFHNKVAVLSTAGNHVRFVPGALARALVQGQTARPQATAGKVREVVLTQTPAQVAQRIGEPEGRATGVRFTRVVHLEESASRIIEHHPRCTYE